MSSEDVVETDVDQGIVSKVLMLEGQVEIELLADRQFLRQSTAKGPMEIGEVVQRVHQPVFAAAPHSPPPAASPAAPHDAGDRRVGRSEIRRREYQKGSDDSSSVMILDTEKDTRMRPCGKRT
jgi:hypothetical protein